MKAGIVLGSYNLPKLIEIQVREIRLSCGDVPILIADDASDRTQFDRLCRIEEHYPGVTLWPNVERIGHSGGDLSAFWKGLQWAKATGLEYLCKLSQRLVLSSPKWLSLAVEDLCESGKSLLAQERMLGEVGLFLRTEALAVRVIDWSTSKVLAELRPRRMANPRLLRGHAEGVIWWLLQTYFAGAYHEWKLIPKDRSGEYPEGVVWHHANGAREMYETLARKHGMTLDEGFFTDEWMGKKGYKAG